MSGDVQPTLLAAFDSPVLCIAEKTTDRKIKRCGKPVKSCFLQTAVNKSCSCTCWWIIKGQKPGLWEQRFRVWRDVFKSCLSGSFILSVKGCSSFWFLACRSWREVGVQQGCWKFLHGEKPGRISSILSFSLVLYKPEVWIAFLPASLTKQSWQEKKKVSNCGRKVIKKNN